MSAITRFPDRASVVVRIIRNEDAWLVLAGSNGWLHGHHADALEDARWLAENTGLPIRVAAA